MRLRYGLIPLLVIMALLAGCGASAGEVSGGPPPPTAPAANFATVAPAQAASVCHLDDAYAGPVVRLGDIYVTQAGFALAYPAFMLADGTPLKPLKLDDPSRSPNPGTAPVNPDLKESPGGYKIGVCNASAAQSHTLQSVTVRLDALVPYSGQLNSWNPCDGPYYPPAGQAAGGCGGAYAGDESLHAAFPPGATANATAVATQTGTGNSNDPGGAPAAPLPLTLAPGQKIEVNIGLTPPSAPGTYTFAFGLSIDRAAPIFASSGVPVLLAPVAHKWSGEACLEQAMKAQIPANSQDYFICPVL
jgi:hypothetical protein